MKSFADWKARPGRPALVALLEATQGRVFAICRAVLQDRHEAEEAAQETLLKIVAGIDGVGDEEHYERWVGTVAKRTALDRRRTNRRRKARGLAGASRGRPGPCDGLHEAIGQLPGDERALIVERYFERRTLEEMAQRRGLSDVGVRKRIEKAHEKLKRMLGAFGAVIMKARSAAVITVVFIPLFLLGGGVFVASMRRTPQTEPVVSGPSEPSKIAKWLAEGAPRAAKEPAPDQTVPVDRQRVRAEFLATLERMRACGRRSAECKELWPMATTEEEGRAMQREKIALDTEVGQLYTKLGELAALSPETILELVRNATELPDRLRLMGMISPDVNAEIADEGSPSGPLLSGLLALASGDSEDKAYLAAFAGSLTRANRDLGRTLVSFLSDPDFHVRVHAAQALAHLTHEGNLKEFLAGQVTTLKASALRDDGGVLDHQVRGSVLRILASLESDEADDFILQQFESLESRHDLGRITALVMASPRIAARHEARLVLAIQRAFDLPFQHYMHYSLLQAAEHLPEAPRAAISQFAEPRRPSPEHGHLPLVSRTGYGRSRGPYRSMTGVSRWVMNPSSESVAPSVRIRR